MELKFFPISKGLASTTAIDVPAWSDKTVDRRLFQEEMVTFGWYIDASAGQKWKKKKRPKKNSARIVDRFRVDRVFAYCQQVFVRSFPTTGPCCRKGWRKSFSCRRPWNRSGWIIDISVYACQQPPAKSLWH
jgi:hypothetical protein